LTGIEKWTPTVVANCAITAQARGDGPVSAAR
jgi:hypothetical protein